MAVVQRGAAGAQEESLVGAPAVVQRTLCSLAGKAATLVVCRGDGDVTSGPHIGDGALEEFATHDSGTHRACRVVDNGGIHEAHVLHRSTVGAAKEASLVIVILLHVEVRDDVELTVKRTAILQFASSEHSVAMIAYRGEVRNDAHVEVVHQTDIDGVAALVHKAAHPAQFLRQGHLVPAVLRRCHCVALEAAV